MGKLKPINGQLTYISVGYCPLYTVTIVFFKKNRHPLRLFHLFLSFQKNITILQQINVKNVHPVYGAGIQAHDLWNMSLLP